MNVWQLHIYLSQNLGFSGDCSQPIKTADAEKFLNLSVQHQHELLKSVFVTAGHILFLRLNQTGFDKIESKACLYAHELSSKGVQTLVFGKTKQKKQPYFI